MTAVVNGTDGITFPSWTTPTRPATPVAGQAGFNTTIGAMETYTGSAWSTSDLPATGASGNFLQSTGTAWTSASTLNVSNGGTGVTTLTTAYGVLAAGTTATGALQNIGTGTSGQILKSNGPGVLPSFQAAAAGGFSNMTVYASPGTFTTPSTTTQIKVTVVGGGGGGGPGTAGGTSSFGALASATGGSGCPATYGAAGGAGSAGTLLIQGQAGATGGVAGGTVSGVGGCSFLGGAGSAGPISSGPSGYGAGGTGRGSNPANPGTFGGGGAGGTAIYVGPVTASTGYPITIGTGGTSGTSSAGGAGVVVVEY